MVPSSGESMEETLVRQAWLDTTVTDKDVFFSTEITKYFICLWCKAPNDDYILPLTNDIQKQ